MGVYRSLGTLCYKSRRSKYALISIFIIALIVTCRSFKNDKLSVANIQSCEVRSEERLKLFPLLAEVNKTLSKLKITYFLCYNSLWGSIQEYGPLPWERNGHLCILGNSLMQHDEAYIYRSFENKDLGLSYSSAEGEYTITNRSLGESSPQVSMVVFEEDERLGKMFRRVGWKRRLLPPDCDAHQSLECFPDFLVTPPLTYKPFGPLNLPVPREGIDILQYHYPDTWWKPLKSPC